MKKLAILTLATLFSSTALAAQDNIIFSCKTSIGKSLIVQKVGGDYHFSYDKTSFKNPISEVISNSDSFIAGGSGFITSSLELKNNGTSYTIQFSQPRNNLKKVDDIEISISKGEQIKFLECDDSQKILHNFDKKIMKKTGFDL